MEARCFLVVWLVFKTEFVKETSFKQDKVTAQSSEPLNSV